MEKLKEPTCSNKIKAELKDFAGSPSTPSDLHLSPDLGIDSDQGRFSSLEHSSKEAHTYTAWADNKGFLKSLHTEKQPCLLLNNFSES